MHKLQNYICENETATKEAEIWDLMKSGMARRKAVIDKFKYFFFFQKSFWSYLTESS